MSSPRRVQLEPAYLLHRRPFRDSSLIVELWTPDHGRVGAVARGARRPKSRLRSGLVPFVALLASWSGRGDLATLTHAEPAPGQRPPRDHRHAVAASYVSELILRLVQRGDPHPELYADYARTLAALGTGATLAPTLRIFEKRLLGHIGYGLNLRSTADAATPIAPDQRYLYDVRLGARPLAGGVRDEASYAGDALLALELEEFATRSQLTDARRLLREALDACLGPAPLRSRGVARALWRNAGGVEGKG